MISRMKILKIAGNIVVLAVFFVAVATFAAQPAHAKSGMGFGYKHVYVHEEGYRVHVGQMDFMRTIGGGDGYRGDGKRPKQTFGIALAVGANRQDVSGESVSSVYFALPLIYEYVFSFGLGFSAGVNLPVMLSIGPVGDETKLSFGAGVGFSDLGVSYTFNDGFHIYARGNIGYATFFGANLDILKVKADEPDGLTTNSVKGLMWGAGGGIGFWF